MISQKMNHGAEARAKAILHKTTMICFNFAITQLIFCTKTPKSV